jgi:hypothetical protein
MANVCIITALNAERASFQAPGIRQKLQAARARMLQAAYDEYSK